MRKGNTYSFRAHAQRWTQGHPGRCVSSILTPALRGRYYPILQVRKLGSREGKGFPEVPARSESNAAAPGPEASTLPGRSHLRRLVFGRWQGPATSALWDQVGRGGGAHLGCV